LLIFILSVKIKAYEQIKFTRVMGMTIGTTSLLPSPGVDTKNMNPIDISVLKRSLSSAETSAEMLTRMMETGVRPYIGSNIDVRV